MHTADDDDDEGGCAAAKTRRRARLLQDARQWTKQWSDSVATACQREIDTRDVDTGAAGAKYSFSADKARNFSFYTRRNSCPC